MIPTPITLDEDRQHFEYVVYVNQQDAGRDEQQVDLPIGHSADIAGARNILCSFSQALIMLAAPDVTVKAQTSDPLNGRITMLCAGEVFCTLHARIQIEPVATVRRLFNEA